MIQYFPLLISFLLFSCNTAEQEETKGASSNKVVPKTKVKKVEAQQFPNNVYSWKSDYDSNMALANQIPCPKNYERIKTEAGSFANWLQGIPLEDKGSAVHYHSGEKKSNQNVHFRVIDIDTGKRDLQQCADAVMRLQAEYHYSQEAWDKIHFNYTSGDKVAFDDWRKGRKPKVSGNSVNFTAVTNQVDNSYSNFKKYMLSIFNYAGTASLSKELPTIKTSEMRPGDTFIQGGFPGHAVMVMDMAINLETGKKVFLLAQSYMPAQDMHILKNPDNSKLSPWYELDFGNDLFTPEWSFYNAQLKRFKD